MKVRGNMDGRFPRDAAHDLGHRVLRGNREQPCARDRPLKCPSSIRHAFFQSANARKAWRIEEGRLRADHVHRLLWIPPKYSVAQVVGCIMGHSSLGIQRPCGSISSALQDIISGLGDTYVSTVGREEATIREYIRTQEAIDRRWD